MKKAAAKNRIDEYLGSHRKALHNIQGMWRDRKVLMYGDDWLPVEENRSIFLGGPTSRSQILEYNWRSMAVYQLRKLGFTGVIFVPEPRGQEREGDFTEKKYIHAWEKMRLDLCTVAMFWVPRNASELLALNTNWEAGWFNAKYPQKTIIGWPEDAIRMGLPGYYLADEGLSVSDSLEDLCKVAMSRL